MTRDERGALTDVRGYAAANRIRIARHAWERMAERGVLYEDVHYALATAGSCEAQDQERWKVFGTDRDGEDLVLIVVLESGVVVVTVY